MGLLDKLSIKEHAYARTVGYWHSDSSPRFIHPKHLVGKYKDEGLKNKICYYLRNAKLHTSWMGFSYCRFECGCQDMGTVDKYDNNWIWPEGLEHYVRDHNVILPEEFIETMRKNDFTPPDPDLFRSPCNTWWIQWCRNIPGSNTADFSWKKHIVSLAAKTIRTYLNKKGSCND